MIFCIEKIFFFLYPLFLIFSEKNNFSETDIYFNEKVYFFSSEHNDWNDIFYSHSEDESYKYKRAFIFGDKNIGIAFSLNCVFLEINDKDIETLNRNQFSKDFWKSFPVMTEEERNFLFVGGFVNIEKLFVKQNNKMYNSYNFFGFLDNNPQDRIKNILNLIENNPNFFQIEKDENFYDFYFMKKVDSFSESAEASLALNYLSFLLRKPLPANFVMTGSIEFDGKISKVEGIYWKMRAADNFNFEVMLLPLANKEDVEFTIDSYKFINLKKIIFFDNFFELYDFVFKNKLSNFLYSNIININ